MKDKNYFNHPHHIRTIIPFKMMMMILLMMMMVNNHNCLVSARLGNFDLNKYKEYVEEAKSAVATIPVMRQGNYKNGLYRYIFGNLPVSQHLDTTKSASEWSSTTDQMDYYGSKEKKDDDGQFFSQRTIQNSNGPTTKNVEWEWEKTEEFDLPSHPHFESQLLTNRLVDQNYEEKPHHQTSDESSTLLVYAKPPPEFFETASTSASASAQSQSKQKGDQKIQINNYYKKQTPQPYNFHQVSRINSHFDRTAHHFSDTDPDVLTTKTFYNNFDQVDHQSELGETTNLKPKYVQSSSSSSVRQNQNQNFPNPVHPYQNYDTDPAASRLNFDQTPLIQPPTSHEEKNVGQLSTQSFQRQKDEFAQNPWRSKNYGPTLRRNDDQPMGQDFTRTDSQNYEQFYSAQKQKPSTVGFDFSKIFHKNEDLDGASKIYQNLDPTPTKRYDPSSRQNYEGNFQKTFHHQNDDFQQKNYGTPSLRKNLYDFDPSPPTSQTIPPCKNRFPHSHHHHHQQQQEEKENEEKIFSRHREESRQRFHSDDAQRRSILSFQGPKQDTSPYANFKSPPPTASSYYSKIPDRQPPESGWAMDHRPVPGPARSKNSPYLSHSDDQQPHHFPNESDESSSEGGGGSKSAFAGQLVENLSYLTNRRRQQQKYSFAKPQIQTNRFGHQLVSRLHHIRSNKNQPPNKSEEETPPTEYEEWLRNQSPFARNLVKALSQPPPPSTRHNKLKEQSSPPVQLFSTNNYVPVGSGVGSFNFYSEPAKFQQINQFMTHQSSTQNSESDESGPSNGFPDNDNSFVPGPPYPDEEALLPNLGSQVGQKPGQFLLGNDPPPLVLMMSQPQNGQMVNFQTSNLPLTSFPLLAVQNFHQPSTAVSNSLAGQIFQQPQTKSLAVQNFIQPPPISNSLLVQNFNHQSPNSAQPSQHFNHQSPNSAQPSQHFNHQSPNSAQPSQNFNHQSPNSAQPSQNFNHQSPNSAQPSQNFNHQSLSNSAQPSQNLNPSTQSNDHISSISGKPSQISSQPSQISRQYLPISNHHHHHTMMPHFSQSQMNPQQLPPPTPQLQFTGFPTYQPMMMNSPQILSHPHPPIPPVVNTDQNQMMNNYIRINYPPLVPMFQQTIQGLYSSPHQKNVIVAPHPNIPSQTPTISSRQGQESVSRNFPSSKVASIIHKTSNYIGDNLRNGFQSFTSSRFSRNLPTLPPPTTINNSINRFSSFQKNYGENNSDPDSPVVVVEHDGIYLGN